MTDEENTKLAELLRKKQKEWCSEYYQDGMEVYRMTDEENAKLVELLRKKQKQWCSDYYQDGMGNKCYAERTYGNVYCPANDSDNGCCIGLLISGINRRR
jgi:hypothetical protein